MFMRSAGMHTDSKQKHVHAFLGVFLMIACMRIRQCIWERVYAYVYVRVYAYVYVRVYAYVYVRVYAHVYVRVYAYAYVHVYAYVYVRVLYTLMHLYVDFYLRELVFARVCICVCSCLY